MRRVVKIILLIMIAMFIITGKAYAVGGSFPATTTNPSGDPSTPGSPSNLDGNGTNASWTGQRDGDKQYECYYSQGLGYSNDFSINAYDLNGESIIPYSVIPNKSIKSGTWVGINASEVSSASWSVSNFHIYEIKKNYECSYHKDGETQEYYYNADSCSYPYYSIGECEKCCQATVTIFGVTQTFKYDCKKCYWSTTTGALDHKETYSNRDYYENFNCPKWNELSGTRKELDETKVEISTDPINCESHAINSAHGAAQSKVGNKTTSVEYVKEVVNEKTGNIEMVPDTLGAVVDPDPDKTFDIFLTKRSGIIQVTYRFEPSKICLNTKTAHVLYGTDCISKDYIIEMKNGRVYDKYLNQNITYWHYFIPLTAKTSDGTDDNLDAYVKMSRIDTLDFAQCANGMKTDGYESLIAPLEGKYKGDYDSDETNSIDYKRLEADGKCRFATIINFKVNQEFYGEEDKKIIGYGAFFRPIDVNNPFPNGLSNKSYWKKFSEESSTGIVIKDLKNANGQPLDASNPYGKLTYRVDLTNDKINAIKAFNRSEEDSEGVYTSWKAVNKKGVSDFVNDYIDERKENINNFYNIGCGPANKDWEECRK